MIIVIIGPTGVGKTKVSVALAKKINAEIISGDSVQVYKHLNIGSAKVTSKEMQGIKHHLIDVIELEEEYSSSVFQTMVRQKITEITNKNKNVIICGGTGYYIKACLYDYRFSKKRDNHKFATFSDEELYNKLLELDYNQAKLLHKNNRRRVERALEVAMQGNKISENQKGNKRLYDFTLIGLTMDREKIYQRIDKRVNIMLENGLLDEVKALYPKKAYIHAIGYNELFDYLDNKLSYDEAVEKIKRNSRRYAKKQFTWFNNKMATNWIDVEDKELEVICDEILQKVKKNTSF